jgi:Phytanoyl-CoA dioxygenase (PhyH)
MAELTPQMRADFRRNGYLVIPNLIDKDLVSQGLEMAQELIEKARPGWRERSAGFYMGSEFIYATNGSSDDDTISLGGVNQRDHPARLFYDKAGISDVVDQLFSSDFPSAAPGRVQAIATIPPIQVVPKPHIDGFVVGDPVPNTFSLLVSILVSPQAHEGDGGLFVWPGSHLEIGWYARTHGVETVRPEELPGRIALADPVQITAPAGSILLAHYLLGHCGGTHTSSGHAERLYFRVKAEHHDSRWKATITDPLLEYAL